MLPYDISTTVLDGVPLILPEDGKVLPECFYSGLTVDNASAAAVTIQFDYKTIDGSNLQDSDTVTTNANYVTPGLKSVRIDAVGDDCDIRFIMHTPIGG